MKRRTYKDPRFQRTYESTLDNYHSGARGWIGPMVHGLFNEDGSRFRGAAGHSAFWNGFDGLTLSRGRLMHTPGSYARACYMAGRDAARGVK